ncbi:acetyl/propionyl/methylcrotonyl-CoA carboxylase subunit alpha [Novosphingopyxis sp.]|uniref:acetyl/propionyl/methylcrotonyl-CoA carboxylase subunit alpha n=1 Tax=Novosphingopyxis sp. TaxID=2709690 RepID=UPI003B59C21A
MLESLLIANRGEIACRIIRSARKLGIRTVAVYSDADRNALHVRSADEAVPIGPSPANESYLVGDKIIAAAKESGAEAIHPGYGFLSENADFAQAVLDAGLIWVGPKPDSIRKMGLKDAAKTLMDAAGVPTTPGYIGDNQEASFLAERAAEIGYPVLIKAVAGGGGKGMRKVEAADQFNDSLQSAQREAKAAFANDIVLIEKWVESPRHIEVQVFGDSHGNVVHLFERDCSLQRRHQKVIEEAPAPGMDEATRAAVCDAAVRAARAVDYEGAGTIEFIADGSDGLRSDRIWFMEMNTRLQVEHPVTEEITGVDLVEWQLRVASGEPLPMRQDELSITGHAIEARLYAEDPASGFLPSTGRLELFDLDDSGRVETGVETGADISPFYDPMIAKMIVHAETREEARAGLRDMIAGSAVWPVKSNAGFLVRALDHPDFVAADLDTGLIARAGDDLMPGGAPSDEELGEQANALLQLTDMPGFRLNAPPKAAAWFLLDGEPVELPVGANASGEVADELLIAEEGQVWRLSPWRVEGSGAATAGDGAILAPMPGKIIAVGVAEGDRVKAGDRLVTLEAMKMEHSLTAPFDGTVTALKASEGAQVQKDAALVVVEADEA